MDAMMQMSHTETDDILGAMEGGLKFEGGIVASG